MAEKRENSVLISLRELRKIEDDRQAQEKVDERKREEDVRRAREEAERQAREETERQRRETEETERRRVEDAERRTREDQLRVEEAERRARVEAQMKIEAERMRLEVEAKHAIGTAKKPKALIAGIVAVSLAAMGVLGWFAYSAYQKNQQQLADQLAFEQEIRSLQKQIDDAFAEQKALMEQWKAADDVRKKQIEAQMADNEARQQALKTTMATVKDARPGGSGRPKPPRETPTKVKPKCDPRDPLCGADD
ncbi:MAG: hypothetical protein V2A73_20095 [Pseudomonadota bacterium]